MNLKFKKGFIELSQIDNFDINQTLDCGQSFRWYKDEQGFYNGIAFGKQLKIKQDENCIYFYNCTAEEFKNIWYDYFDLDFDYKKVSKEFSNLNETLKKAIVFSSGIRILKQEPWETLCSFIISQNNNIPRIKGIISSLCNKFGNVCSNGNMYTFPTAEVISKLNCDDLAILRCGFRDKYILDAAKKVSSKEINLNEMYNIDINIAREQLMKIRGVGPKVAECVLLYGFHRLECFPLDVWMKRVMENLFPKNSPVFFGNLRGIAQQYLFHYSRNHPEIFKN